MLDRRVTTRERKTEREIGNKITCISVFFKTVLQSFIQTTRGRSSFGVSPAVLCDEMLGTALSLCLSGFTRGKTHYGVLNLIQG